ncbi:MAG: GNAT family N-acetyltransferase [Burkholderiaceae bacterium]
MPDAWTIRPVAPDDAARVAAHRGFAPSDAEGAAGYAAWLRPRIASGTYVGRLAIAADGGVVGGAGAVLLDWGPTRGNPGGTMARIVNVFTDEPWRRRGIARALLQAVLARCEAAGVREFNLGATPEAAALYASLGFDPYPSEMRRRVRGA